MKTSIYNIFFRGLTLLSKFLFIIFLGKFSVDETNLGVFGIFSTSIALLIYFIGFDFYVFNTREILKAPNEIIDKLRNQLFFHSIGYIIVLPISLLFIFSFGFITMEYLWLFIFLIISEHLGQELYRLFTTLEKSVKANIMLFLRSSVWVWCVFIDYFVFNNPISLKRYIIIWAIFSWSTFLIFTIYAIIDIGIKNMSFKHPDWRWIKSGFKTASFFLIGSVSFQIIQLSDRFMIDYFFGKKLVGVYTAYAQFSNAIDVFTFSAITMIAYPKMIKTFSDSSTYKKIKKALLMSLVGMSSLLILVTCFLGPIIFRFLEKDSILDEINTFYVLLLSVFLLITSNAFHYDLYVKNKDILIVKIAVFSMLINVVLNLILIPKHGILGASIATLVTFLIIFILKFYFSFKTKVDDSI
ncbi:MATE family efflux transporter [Seonamhaeicola maritimus]|uniref:Uncharacterized protein n=1 Tax=Seonamhaeicola maritimus TaxID=2591822 RepID=A0A5C7GHP0_9FLAO|nr:polysaccharide biosynthesis C-terminal domain-containing protein [Seonamhaeicola maritimus]TXG37156.1 hypothetical protein FUA22_11365 [Seonamhaeicola maritimus]